MRGAYGAICESARDLGLSLEEAELASIADSGGMGDAELRAVGEVFGYLAEKRRERCVAMRLSMSRLPLKSPKTFENFDFGRLGGPDRAALEQLPALTGLYASRNIAFIGPEGVGKTHLAQAYARQCCMLGMQSYYIKARELRDKLAKAVRLGSEASVINALVRPNCLVLDEIGRCVFDKASTELLFHIVDRRSEKRDPSTMIVTSNYGADKWGEYFTGTSTLLCTLDRIFDNATVYMMSGPSYRGSSLETYALEAKPVVSRTSV